MRVKELIEQLQKMPQDLRVCTIFDYEIDEVDYVTESNKNTGLERQERVVIIR